MKIYIYNENCIQAGKPVSDRILEQSDDPDDGQDWTCIEGPEEDLLAAARRSVATARKGGGGQYDRRVARTIFEALGWREDDIERELYGVVESD